MSLSSTTSKKKEDHPIEKERVILIRSCLMSEETRRPKELETIRRAGYAATLLSWNKGHKDFFLWQEEMGDFCREIQLRFRAPSDKALLFFFPIWWTFVFSWLILSKWDIAHVLNFDSVIPTIIAGRLKRKPVIYEIMDTYEDHIILPHKIRDISLKIDKLFIRLASSIILVDEMQIEEFGGIPNSRIVVIYDSPLDYINELNNANNNNTKFTMFYAGWFSKIRRLNLDKLFSAIENINNVKLIIGGYGEVEEIKEASLAMPGKVQFIGKITHKEVLRGSIEADLLFVLRDPIILENRYICGSKILEAMMCGNPILANKGTSTANKVREENCGLVVDANNVEEIRAAIIKLRDNPGLCKELGTNSRKAYEERYSWKIMEKRLLKLYKTLCENGD